MLCVLNMINGDRYWGVLTDSSWVIVKLPEPHNTTCVELSKSLVKSKGPKILEIIERLSCV